MDFLGLRTLTVIADALTNIKNNRGIEINLDEILLEDEKDFANALSRRNRSSISVRVCRHDYFGKRFATNGIC